MLRNAVCGALIRREHLAMRDHRVAAIRLNDHVSCEDFQDHRRYRRRGRYDDIRGCCSRDGEQKSEEKRLIGHSAIASSGLQAPSYHISLVLLGSLRPPFTDRARRTWARPVRGTGRAARSAETLGMATSRQRARQLSSPMCLAPWQCLLAYPMLVRAIRSNPVAARLLAECHLRAG